MMATVFTPEATVAQPDWRRKLIEALLAMPDPQIKEQMTYEEFLAWADEDTLAEWVDGKVIIASPASLKHQQTVAFLQRILGAYVEYHNLGIVLSAPFQMKLQRSGREPDLLFVSEGHKDRLRNTHLDGPADLMVEIISPESVGRDRGEKYYEYAEAGIQEYWLIDPETRWAEFYLLSEGRYRLALEGSSGVYHSKVLPEFRLCVEWLWQPTRTLDILRELKIIP